MVITLENAMTYIGIFMFCMAIMNYMVIVPFNKAIQDLRATLDDMDKDCRERSERLALVEASSRQAHKRIDEIKEDIALLRNEVNAND